MSLRFAFLLSSGETFEGETSDYTSVNDARHKMALMLNLAENTIAWGLSGGGTRIFRVEHIVSVEISAAS